MVSSLDTYVGRDALRELLRELIQISDVVSENFAAGVFERLGFTYESLRAIRKSRAGGPPVKRKKHTFIHKMPFKMRFHKSGLYISSLLPLGMGFLVGVLASIMGVGGGFSDHQLTCTKLRLFTCAYTTILLSVLRTGMRSPKCPFAMEIPWTDSNKFGVS